MNESNVYKLDFKSLNSYQIESKRLDCVWKSLTKVQVFFKKK